MIAKTEASSQAAEAQTGLPEGWQMVRFGDVVRNVDVNERSPLENGLERYIGLEHIEPDSLHIKTWGLLEDGTSFTRKFVQGQVLFGKRRAYQRKVAIAEFDGICSGDILVFEPANEQLIPQLLPFIAQSEGFFQHALGTSAGSLSPRTRWRDLAEYTLPLPPTGKQQQIAEILWAADDSFEASFLVVDTIQKAIDTIRAEKFCNIEKTTAKLANLCNPNGIQIGPFGSQLHASDYVDQGIPVIMPADMADDQIREESIARITLDTANRLSIHKVLPGDILLPRRGELNKRVFIRSEQTGWICGTGSIRIRARSDVSARALFHALAAPQTVAWLENHAVGTTMPNLNATIVSNIPVSLPEVPQLDGIVASLDSLIEARDLALQRIQNSGLLKNSLVNVLLSGNGE